MDMFYIANVTMPNIMVENHKFLPNYHTFLLTIALFWGLIVCLGHFKNGKKQVVWKGPPKLPLIGSTHHLILPGVDKLKVFMDWVLKYGRIFKVNFLMRDLVVVNCPAMIQKILSSPNPSHLNKQRFFYDTLFVGPLANGILVSDVKVWTPHRKVMTKAFSFKSQVSYLGTMNSHAKEMIQSMIESEDVISDETNADAASNCFSDALHYSIIKTLLDLIVGSTSYTKEQILEARRTFTIAKEVNMYRIEHPWLLLKPIWTFHPLKQKLEEFTRFYEVFVKNITTKKRLEGDDKKSAYISQADNDKPVKSIVDLMVEAGMKDKEIVDEFCTVMLGGQESTGLTMSFFLFYLALNSKHQKLCQDEIDGVFRNTKGSGDDPSMDDLCDLKHVERCLLETLRLLPPIAAIIREISEPIKLDDNLELPAGANIFINLYTLHRTPEFFPDPERFDPDRFLPEKCKARHPYAYIPFSAGPRNCIGYKFGMMELKVIAAHVLRNFEVFTGHAKFEDSCMDYQAPTLHPRAGLKLFFKRRTQKFA